MWSRWRYVLGNPVFARAPPVPTSGTPLPRGDAAPDGDEAVALTRALSPDVVLMDIRMPGTDGLA